MTTEAINKELNLSEGKARATAERLAEAGLLEAIGNGRGRTYVLSSKLYKDPTEYVRQTDIDQLRYRELILKLAQTQGQISRKNVIELLHVSGPQAYRLLQKLVDDNELKREGNTSAARYKIEEE